MDAPLTVADQTGTPCALIENYKGDFAFGSGEQDFELTFDSPLLYGGEFVYIEGTEYGGVVDEIKTISNSARTTYRGRTWHGILQNKILSPDQDQDYLQVKGHAKTVLEELIERIHLSELFIVDTCDNIQVNYAFKRYCDAYSGIKSMLKASGAKLVMHHEQRQIHISAQKVQVIDNQVDSDIMHFCATKQTRPINHLICLGKGELKDRHVLHLYADEAGSISRTQTLFGKDERTITYDYSSAEKDELESQGTKKLKELQQQGGVDVSLTRFEAWNIGDIIVARDTRSHTQVTAEVLKKIARIKDGILKVQYEVGTQAKQPQEASSHGSSASSGSTAQVVYTAGRGIKIISGTISAEVTAQDLQNTKDIADEAHAASQQARRIAQNASNDISSAFSKAAEAKRRADEAYAKASQGTSAYERTYSENGERLHVKRYGKVVAGTIDGWTAQLPNARSTHTIATLPDDMRPAFPIEVAIVGKHSYAEIAAEIKPTGEIIVWSLGSGTLGTQQIYGNFSFITQ